MDTFNLKVVEAELISENPPNNNQNKEKLEFTL